MIFKILLFAYFIHQIKSNNDIMNSKLIFFFLFTAVPLLSAQPQGIREIVEAERIFAKNCVIKGQNQATYEQIAEHGILFRPGPIVVKPTLVNNQPPPMVLKTFPEFVDAADSQDFGYATGPFEFQNHKPFSEPVLHGFYVSVWEKQKDGIWKVIIGHNVDLGNKLLPEYALNFTYPKEVKRVGKFEKTAPERLLNIDQAFLESWLKQPKAVTFLNFLSSDAKVFRDGEIPTQDKKTITRWIDDLEYFEWNPLGSKVAQSGDMAYTYGSFKSKKANSKQEGFYLRILEKGCSAELENSY